MLSLKYGNTGDSSLGYITFGMILCNIFNDIDRGYNIGVLAMKLTEKYDAVYLKSKVIFSFYTLIAHWKEHPDSFLKALIIAYESGIEAGELQYSSYCINYYSAVFPFLVGENLEDLKIKTNKYLNVLKKMK